MEGYQKYVEAFKKVRLLSIGTLVLSVFLVVYLVGVPMFTYEVAGVKGKFSLFDDCDLFMKKLELTKQRVKIKDVIVLIAPFLIVLLLVGMPYVGLSFGGFSNADTFAYNEYIRIKDKGKPMFTGASYTVTYQIIRAMAGILVLILFVWYIKDEKLGGYFYSFSGINFFGVLYLLLTAAGYVLFFYLKKEYDFIKKQIEEE